MAYATHHTSTAAHNNNSFEYYLMRNLNGSAWSVRLHYVRRYASNYLGCQCVVGPHEFLFVVHVHIANDATALRRPKTHQRKITEKIEYRNSAARAQRCEYFIRIFSYTFGHFHSNQRNTLQTAGRPLIIIITIIQFSVFGHIDFSCVCAAHTRLNSDHTHTHTQNSTTTHSIIIKNLIAFTIIIF